MKRPQLSRKRVRCDRRRQRMLRDTSRRLTFESLEDRRVLATLVPLELALDTNSVPEDAGATGVLATVSRPSDQSDNALVISLLSSDSFLSNS